MIGIRIKQLIDSQGMSNVDFERKIDIANGSVGNYIRKNTAIGSDKLEKIVRLFPNLDLKWLVTGEGEMWQNGQQPAGTVAVQLSTGHQANNTQHVGDAAALAIAHERIKALEEQVQQLTARLADKDEIIALLKKSAQG